MQPLECRSIPDPFWFVLCKAAWRKPAVKKGGTTDLTRPFIER